MAVTTYDSKSYELAEHFLADDPVARTDQTKHVRLVHELAIEIQTAVEDWLWHKEQSDASKT